MLDTRSRLLISPMLLHMKNGVEWETLDSVFVDTKGKLQGSQEEKKSVAHFIDASICRNLTHF